MRALNDSSQVAIMANVRTYLKTTPFLYTSDDQALVIPGMRLSGLFVVFYLILFQVPMRELSDGSLLTMPFNCSKLIPKTPLALSVSDPPPPFFSAPLIPRSSNPPPPPPLFIFEIRPLDLFYG